MLVGKLNFRQITSNLSHLSLNSVFFFLSAHPDRLGCIHWKCPHFPSRKQFQVRRTASKDLLRGFVLVSHDKMAFVVIVIYFWSALV